MKQFWVSRAQMTAHTKRLEEEMEEATLGGLTRAEYAHQQRNWKELGANLLLGHVVHVKGNRMYEALVERLCVSTFPRAELQSLHVMTADKRPHTDLVTCELCASIMDAGCSDAVEVRRTQHAVYDLVYDDQGRERW